MMRRASGIASVFAALVLFTHPARAQWTVTPRGWFMSQSVNVGTIPDRFDPAIGATNNGLHKVEWGLYFIYGLHDGLSIGLGQGFANLRSTENNVTAQSTGFGATGVFVMKRLAHGKLGVLSIQPRIDLPLLYDTEQRPVLGPIKPDAEVRLLYGTGYGIGARRGWISVSAGGSAWRHGNSEIRYDATVGLDAAHRVTIMAQSFNVAALAPQGSGIAYSSTKVGGSVVIHASESVGIVGGYYAGVSGKNTARERTVSIGFWLTHHPGTPGTATSGQ